MSLKELKRWVLVVYDLNMILPWFVLHLLLGLTFLEFFVIGEILGLISVGKSSLLFLTYFMKGMHVLISLLTYDLFIENNFIGVIGFHLVFSYNFLLIGINYLSIVFVIYFIYEFWSSPPIFVCIFF